MDTNNLLKDRNFTILVDKSASMGFNNDTPSGISRWKSAHEATLGLAAKISELDKDGITFYAFNSAFTRHENITPNLVANLWTEHKPTGGTPYLANVLRDAFNSYFTRKQAGQTKKNGEAFLVVTGDEPEDKAQVAQTIIDATRKMERSDELSVSFFQVGKDAATTTYLQALSNGVNAQGAKFDIVDTITMEKAGTKSLTEVLLASITN